MQSVVDRTGVPADTIRSWERRHGFPTPARDALNQRVYSNQDIQAILRLKEQTARGVTVKEALRLLPDASPHKPGADSLATPAREAEPPQRLTPRSPSPVVDRLVDALQAFDAAGARSVLHTELVTQSPESVAFESILPATERLAIAPDVATGFAREFLVRILVSLLNASDPDNGRERVVVATVTGSAGSRESLLALAHALAMSRRDLSIVWLGKDADVANLRQVISRLRPLAVLLVADDPEALQTARGWWQLLHEIPTMQQWGGKRLIASPQPPLRSATSTPEGVLWLPPEADASRVLLDPDTFDGQDATQVASDR